MNLPIAIVVAAAILGGSIGLSGRYAIDAAGDRGWVWRIDRITGAVSLCAVDGCRGLSN